MLSYIVKALTTLTFITFEYRIYKYKAVSASARECRMRHAEMRKMLMWMCIQGAANSIHSSGECSVNSQTLSVWSQYFKEKYVRNPWTYV